jgi:WhiB family redox-sensing transcriptional regulator
MSSLERFTRAPWHDAAACTGESGVLFYPPSRPERRATRLRREARACAICSSCPVRGECLQHAIDNDERYGIWGGMTDRDRLSLASADR